MMIHRSELVTKVSLKMLDEGKEKDLDDDMDLDDLQEKFGGISRYQIGIIVLVSFLPFGVTPFSQIAVFYSAEPDHRCAIPPFENDPPSYQDNNISDTFVPPGEGCKRYAYNLTACEINLESCLSENETSLIDCDNGFVYSDEIYEETTISQFDLVCGRSTLDALANSMYFVGMFVGSALIGPMMDWFGRRLSMLITCIGTIVTSLVVVSSTSYEMFISVRVVEAVFSMPCYIAYYSYVNEMATRRWQTLVGAYANVFSALSHCVLPVIAYFVRTWRYLGICVTIMCTPYLVMYFFIPKSPKWLLTKQRDKEARKVVEKYAKSRKQELCDEDWNRVVQTENKKLIMASENGRYTIVDLFKPPLMRMVSVNICYLWFLVSMVYYGLILNVGTLVGDPYVNAVLNAFVEIIGYLMFFGGTRLMGIRITGSISYTLAGVCCLTTMLLTQFANGNSAMKEAARWVAIGGKLFATLAFGLIYQYTTELYPTIARGTAMSIGSMCARIGSIIMPFTLELQESVPWLTQTLFGTLGIIGGATCLLLPETLDAGLISTIDEAENFYRKNMRFTATMLGKRDEVYHRFEIGLLLHKNRQCERAKSSICSYQSDAKDTFLRYAVNADEESAEKFETKT